MSQFNLLDLCRLCLDKDRVSIPIFEGEGLVKKLFMKIGACLPVKVSESDRLPKKICDDCIYKVELVYSFWNTTANAEKQLLALLGEADSEPQVPLLDDSVKTENEVGMSVRMEESNISSNKSLPGQAVSKIALTNPTVIGGNVSSLSACMEMTNSTGSRLGNDLSNQSREDDSDEEESDVDDDATYSEEEDDPAAIGDGESSFNTVEPTFVNVDHMGDEAGPSGLQHEMEVENMEGEMPVEPSAAQPDEFEFIMVEEQDLLECSSLPPDCILGSPCPETRSAVRDRCSFDAPKNDFDDRCGLVPLLTDLNAVPYLPVKTNAYGKKVKNNSAPVNSIVNPLNVRAGFEKRDVTTEKDKSFFENLKVDFNKTFAQSFAKLRRSSKESAHEVVCPKYTSIVTFVKNFQCPNRRNLKGTSASQHLRKPTKPLRNPAETSKVFEQSEDVVMCYSQVEPYQLYSQVEPLRQIYIKDEVDNVSELQSPCTGSDQAETSQVSFETELLLEDGADNVTKTYQCYSHAKSSCEDSVVAEPPLSDVTEPTFEVNVAERRLEVSAVAEPPIEVSDVVEPPFEDDNVHTHVRDARNITKTNLNPRVCLERLSSSVILFYQTKLCNVPEVIIDENLNPVVQIERIQFNRF